MNFKHDVCSFKYLEGVHFEKRFFFESRKFLAKKTYVIDISNGFVFQVPCFVEFFWNADLLEFSSLIDLWPIV